jgi:hypothetical protein
MMQVNIWAVLVAAVASMIVGSLWYGPLFGKAFMSATGMDKLSPEAKEAMKKSMTLTYLWQFIASAVMFYVLAWLISNLHQGTVSGSLQAAFWAWLGFIVPLKFGDSLWGGKMVLFWIGIGNSLLTLLIGAAIIGAWR